MDIYDWDHHDQFAGDYAAMIDDFRALASHPDVYVALPPWVMTDKAQVGLTEDRMANVIIPAIRSVAATKATPIIDIHALTQNHPEYYHDEIHPNDVGCRDGCHRGKRNQMKPSREFVATCCTSLAVLIVAACSSNPDAAPEEISPAPQVRPTPPAAPVRRRAQAAPCPTTVPPAPAPPAEAPTPPRTAAGLPAKAEAGAPARAATAAARRPWWTQQFLTTVGQCSALAPVGQWEKITPPNMPPRPRRVRRRSD